MCCRSPWRTAKPAPAQRLTGRRPAWRSSSRLTFPQLSSLPDHSAAVTIYQDPTLTIGPGIVKDLVSHFMDGFSGAKITSQVALAKLSASGTQTDPALSYKVVQQYTTWLQVQ